MNIEFYTSDAVIADAIISYIRDEIMRLHRQYKLISRCDVSFRLKKKPAGSEKVCEISMFIAGNTINAKCISKSFDNASKKAVAALEENLVASVKHKTHSL